MTLVIFERHLENLKKNVLHWNAHVLPSEIAQLLAQYKTFYLKFHCYHQGANSTGHQRYPKADFVMPKKI